MLGGEGGHAVTVNAGDIALLPFEELRALVDAPAEAVLATTADNWKESAEDFPPFNPAKVLFRYG